MGRSQVSRSSMRTVLARPLAASSSQAATNAASRSKSRWRRLEMPWHSRFRSRWWPVDGWCGWLKYVNGLADRGHFDAVQVAPARSAEVPDEAGGVRAVVLGVGHPHNGREGSEALVEAKDILMQRGSTPRVYRNMLIFIAADSRQLDNLKDAVRASLAWGEIVRDIERLNLTQSDS